MAINSMDRFERLPESRRKAILARTEELIAEEIAMTEQTITDDAQIPRLPDGLPQHEYRPRPTFETPLGPFCSLGEYLLSVTWATSRAQATADCQVSSQKN